MYWFINNNISSKAVVYKLIVPYIEISNGDQVEVPLKGSSLKLSQNFNNISINCDFNLTPVSVQNGLSNVINNYWFLISNNYTRLSI